MVAYGLVAEYGWHLLLRRQAQMLLAQCIDIKRAVLAFWLGMRPEGFIRSGCGCREIILTAGKIAVDLLLVDRVGGADADPRW
jgi:hypothetical protein